MCGIAASFPEELAFVEHAATVQSHRGPDGVAIKSLGFASLGVNRLAISGLVGGDQPLSSKDGSILVVFNGAIYNAASLASQFEVRPCSRNDGELIHLLYEEFGLEFADYLEGMFAICVADLRRRCLVFAVDQVGIKPMYSCQKGNQLYIASIIQAFPPELRSEVYRVPPGIVWSTTGEARRLSRRHYSDGTLQSLLTSSVREQIPEEVRWGCMLSGGVDSSLITRLATEVAEGVHTFTCGTENSPDLLAAREVAEVLETNHHEVLVQAEELPDIVNRVVEATASFDRWTVMSGVGTYLTAREARRLGCKVLLSGEGADELFGGYDEFQIEPEMFLDAMLLQYQIDLGATECLRLDRATMAHGIEARVPFLSTSVMRYARQLPARAKVRPDLGELGRKHDLRRYARVVLPSNIADRRKQAFTNGSGITGELRRLAESMYPTAEAVELRASFPTIPIGDSLSAWFFSSWLNSFGVSIGTNWFSLADRGLIRQRWSRYWPVMSDSATYGKGS